MAGSPAMAKRLEKCRFHVLFRFHFQAKNQSMLKPYFGNYGKIMHQKAAKFNKIFFFGRKHPSAGRGDPRGCPP
jgi:hypothetical protein